MAVGNDERLKLDGTDNEERLKTSMKRLKEGRGKEGSNVVEVDVMLLSPIFLFFGLPPLLRHPHYLTIALTTLCLLLS